MYYINIYIYIYIYIHKCILETPDVTTMPTCYDLAEAYVVIV